MKLEILNIADLKPLERNVRKHNDKQINELVRSLNQFGQQRAIIIDEKNNILIGNGLYYAMLKKGDTTAECSRAVGLTERAKKKLILTDNKVFSLGVDDYSVIQEYIEDISFDGDFDIAGFDEDILKAMTRELDEISQDVADYGRIPDNYVTEHKEVHEPTGLNQSVSAPNSPAESVQPTGYTNYTPTQEQPVAAVKTDRTIICPCCGEVIHLD